MTAYIMRKLVKLDDIDKQVASMDDAQIELSLLRNCLDFGKLTHMPAQTYHRRHLLVQECLRRTLSNIIHHPFLDQWAHAS